MFKGLELDYYSFDAGNNNDKVAYKKAGKIKNLIFPALTFLEDDDFDYKDSSNELSLISNNEFSQNNMEVVFDSKRFLVGKNARETDSIGGERIQTEDKYKNDETIARFLSSIALATDLKNSKHNVINIKKLMLGLSIDIWKEKKEDCEDFYSNKKFKFSIPTKDGYKDCMIIVQKTVCIAQGMGAFYDLIFNHDGHVRKSELLKRWYLLIDLGGGTTDRFIANGKKPIPDTDKGLNVGVNDVFQQVGSAFKNAPATIVEKVYRKGDIEYWRDKNPLDIDKVRNISDKAFEKMAQRIYRDIDNDLSEKLHRVGSIIIVGGGAELKLYDYLENIFDDRFEVIRNENPILANANGYLKIGLAMENRG